MLGDWIAREGWVVVSWWALATAAGAAALPLCMRLLAGLPDRGYTLARAAGVLLTGFIFWLLGSLGFLQNTPGSILLAWLILLIVSLAVYARQPLNWREWWRENRPVVLLAEVLFVVLLLGWALVRAHQPELRTTEKPMDLMFVSSIMRSETFPPNDGWLAGYAISYYYFGYLIAAMLSMMSGVSSTLGFNMNIALLFALTGYTAFGVAYNLVRAGSLSSRRQDEIHRAGGGGGEAAVACPPRRPALLTGLLAMVFVVLLGNFQAVLIEWPYQARIVPEDYLRFWATQDRIEYPEREQARAAGLADTEPVTLTPGRADPTQWDYWWWFRASRVLTDFNLDGTVSRAAQPIDEFPQFSFLLADSHPHVMALPYVMLAIGLALNLLLIGRAPTRGETVLYALCVGALVFLNTWDGPIYMLALVGAEGLRRLLRAGRLVGADWRALVVFGLTLGALTLLFYLPFLIGFRSQAAGFLPNLTTPTLLPNLFLMFGPFILLLAPFLIVEVRRGDSPNWRLAVQAIGALLVALLLAAFALVLLAVFSPELYGVVLRFTEPYGGINGALPLLIRRRVEGLPTLLLLLLALLVVIARLFPRQIKPKQVEEVELQSVNISPATGFALLLVALGVGLTLTPEFFYLRDNFGTRINTIFKFYYQAWLLLSIASAYAVYSLLADANQRLAPAARTAFSGLLAVVLAVGLFYPVFGIHNRMFVETGRGQTANPAPLSMDGGPGFVPSADYMAILCLSQQIGGDDMVIAEALGGAYNPAYGRVAALTGMPILLGWENHQRQWRGATYDEAVQTRPQDIPTLYTDLRWETAADILGRWGIDYVFYGSSERASYGAAGEEKFQERLERVCESGGSLFYRVTDTALIGDG